MKTAMQQLIEHLEIMDLEGTSVYKKAKLLLIDEKEQIKIAVEDSNGTTFWVKYESSEDYYNKNYNQKNNYEQNSNARILYGT